MSTQRSSRPAAPARQPSRYARLLPARMGRTLLAFACVAVPFVALPAVPAAADDSQVTVDAPAGGTVTVEQTKNLINKVIRVSWDGFKPSEYPTGPNFTEGYTRFPVRVYQCRSNDPVGPQDCYGSLVYDYPGRTDPTPNFDLSSPDGPANYVQIGTAKDGTGAVDIEVLTKTQSVTQGCTADVQCSIVVVPNLGDPKHKDPDFPQYNACATIYDITSLCNAPGGIGQDSIDAPWAWVNRVVIPLSFAPSADDCPIADAQAALLGSPNLERALTEWQPATCVLADPIDFDYTSQGENLSRNAFLNNLTDVGLTNRPADPDQLTDRTYTYAPIATTAVTVAFRVDDRDTKEPITDMKLNPRLIAKMLSESYGWVSWSPAGADYGNPATRGNPITLFQDPEFLELNPGHSWPNDNYSWGASPLIMGDLSDMTYELTRYIQADPDARAFLDGKVDPWGMHVNPNYKNIPYPSEMFELRDPDEGITLEFQPVQGLDQVARKLVTNAYSGTQSTMDGGTPPKYLKFGPDNRGIQPPGSRAFVAIIDTSNAAAYRFPTAALLNGGKAYVAPTAESMAAGVKASTVNPDGITRSADVSATDPAAYPLTMIDYAMVPTSGIDQDKASAIGRLLDYVASSGQQTGQSFGGLPEGYLPLGADLVAQTTKAAAAVRAQAGKPPTTPTPTPPPPASDPPPQTDTGAGEAPPGGIPPVAAPVDVVAPPVVATTAPGADVVATRPLASHTPAWYGLVLPLVLLGGLGVAVLGGVSSWVVGRGGVALPNLTPSRLLPVRRPRGRRGMGTNS